MRNMKIGIAGRPCSGKTTVINRIRQLRPDIPTIEEYAREYIQERGGLFTMAGQHEITITQVVRELEADKTGYISESPSFMGLTYAELYFLRKDDFDLEKEFLLMDMIRHVQKVHYDVIFWLEPQPYKQDNVRYHREEELVTIEKNLEQQMKRYHKGTVVYMDGDIDQRANMIIGAWK